MLIDTHAHLTHNLLLHQLDDFLLKAEEAGVGGVLCVGTTLADSRQGVELAERHPLIRAAVGLHPNDCCRAEPEDWRQIVALSDAPGVVALGETGLDRYWDDCPWEVQVEFFRRHLSLSRQTGLPVVIHTRECAEETLEILRDEARAGDFTGVMHSYTGSLEVARGCIELGLYISFAGMLTFKNGAAIREVARQLPPDRILVETDSPFLTPEPFRGRRPNHPALVCHTLGCLAELRGVAPSQLAEQTGENALRLFSRWQK